MQILLPDTSGALSPYTMKGEPIALPPAGTHFARVAYSAAHVVADPFADADPSGSPAIDWDATMAFRRHLADLGLGVAEAMDTAQRGMGLDWTGALELIQRTRRELPDALVANGAGTDHLDPAQDRSLDEVKRAYAEQIEAIQKVGGRIILMASRALVRVARGPQDYRDVYRFALGVCDQPAILHWLGEMFDPALAGYWGARDFSSAMDTALQVIDDNAAKIDGIKISLLDKEKEIVFRRRLPAGVKMYTGDDFNYPELIEGDAPGYSHALLGIFDPLAPAAAAALTRLAEDDHAGFRALLDPTVPLARHIFRAPTQFYKTGVVFLAWLNGFQSHFVMVGGAQSARSLPHLVTLFKLADGCGLLRDPDLAAARVRALLGVYGVG
jgi:hypothetical protein